MNKKIYIFAAMMLLATTNILWAHAHIHIGKDSTNTLFMFGMPPSMQPEDYWPASPAWGDASDPYNMTREPLKLVHQGNGLYQCEWLECFHSAHPDHGNWQLGGTDPLTQPGWDISIERVSASAGLMFFDPDTNSNTLTYDTDTFALGNAGYNSELWNENGQKGAWHLHKHVLFYVNDPSVGIGETFSATIRAHDNGTTGFGSSEAYTLQFVTVPEPATMVLTALGSLALLRKRRK